ncbi:MAG TPA: aspartate aminotransferase family protein [Candidatus Omnitrophica bacterium]|nr:aspartate aminotransferase family protein [Candidatus Omnitrophota bacterium]
MKKQEIFKAYEDYIMPTYTRMPYIFTKGKGMKMVDLDAKKYLDFFPGWGVSNLGHCHPKVMSAVRDQVSKLIHLPNNFYSPQQARLAKELIYWAFEGKVFFCNSGAEANEAAIKLSRVFGNGERHEIITFKNSFHGRTLACISATGQPKYQEGFAPLVSGFKSVDFNDIAVVKQAVTDKTVGVMLELVQGEGGVNIADKDFVLELRKLCDEKNMLLIIDEVQTGIGRTAKMFAYQHYAVEPDIITLAKALGGGLPIGVMVASKKIADTLGPGMHASTFGGSPLVCKAALAVLKTIQKEKLLKNAADMGQYLKEKLEGLKSKHKIIKQIRGLGLMLGIELSQDGSIIFEGCLKKGLIINCTHRTVLRMMPALDVGKNQIDKAVKILDGVLSSV